MNTFDSNMVSYCRGQFPSLNRTQHDREVVFFDGPAGTQVPYSVVDAMTEYFFGCNANHGGVFGTSVQSDRWLDQSHQALADFVGADDPDEIAFGQNMTSLTFAFSRALAKTWRPGDEIVVTALDHDANISPWVQAAKDVGATVRWVRFNDTDYTLDLDQMQDVISDRTRLVAVGCASNATGGINPVNKICQMAHARGAYVYLDAVHYGPHGLINVKDWDCDFLACSAYKFFGPHIGILWGRRELLENLVPYKVRPASDDIPGKWMTGTQSHESIVGGMACVDYLAELGRRMTGQTALGRRAALSHAFAEISRYERELSRKLLEGLTAMPEIKIYGISDVNRLDQRFPTFSITHDAISTTQLAQQLAAHGIYVWNGNYYALEFTERLGLEPEGMIRIGLVHYNTTDEIDRLLAAIGQSVSATAGNTPKP